MKGREFIPNKLSSLGPMRKARFDELPEAGYDLSLEIVAQASWSEGL
jgi:hypothetical protein